MARTILVTGAAGQLGQLVLAELVQKKLKDTRIVAATRDPQKLQGKDGFDVVKMDFDDEASLAAGFKGVDRVLLISTDAMDRPGRRQEQHKRAIAAAAAAGVKHVVYTSIVNPNKDSPMAVAEDHRLTEEALTAEKRLGHTVLRNNLYAELLLGSLPGAFAAGALYAASGDGKIGYVSRVDCARAAAAALAADFDGRRVLDVTGPAALSNAEIAALASSIAGKPLPFVALTSEQAVAGLMKAGFPEFVAKLFVSFDEGAKKGELDVATQTVAELTGAPATDLKTFLTTHKAAWVKA